LDINLIIKIKNFNLKGQKMNNFEEKLNKYAEVIVKIGANVQKGQKVWVNCTTDALPLVYKVTELAYRVGASDVHVKLTDDKLSRLHAEYQSILIFLNGRLTREMIILIIM